MFLGTLFPLIFSQQAPLNGGWPLPNNRMFVYYSALINLSNDVYRRMPYLWKCLALVLILPLFFEILHNFWKTTFLTCVEQLNSVPRNKLGHHQRAPHLTVDCTLNLYHVSYFIQSDRWKLNRWVTMNLLIVWGRGGWGWTENV